MPSYVINANVTFPIEPQPINSPPLFLSSAPPTKSISQKFLHWCSHRSHFTAKAKDVILFLARPEAARRTTIDRGWFHVSQAHALVSENDEGVDDLNGFSARILVSTSKEVRRSSTSRGSNRSTRPSFLFQMDLVLVLALNKLGISCT
jgi:hypothetical protein